MQHIKALLFRLRAYALRRDRLPPTPDVGALKVLFVYEGFGSTRLAALACYALAGRRCAPPPPRYGYAARSAGSNRRSLSLAN